jgi:hypothetical protein
MTPCSRSQRASFVAVFGLLIAGASAQKTTALPAGQPTPNRSSISQRTANFTDTTSMGFKFEYIASHTSKKYLIETMGSGVALFDYDNDGRPDIYAVNGAPLNDPTPKGIPDPGALSPITNPGAAPQRVMNFFDERHILSREEFFRILRKSQNFGKMTSLRLSLFAFL